MKGFNLETRMKTLSDKTQVTSRSYYYLLDWNDTNNWEFIRTKFKKERLRDLNIAEYRMLWSHATNVELTGMLSVSKLNTENKNES